MAMAKFGKGVTYHVEVPATKSYEPRGPSRSRDKLKSLYLLYRNVYGHKIWQDDDLLWAASTHRVTWPYNHLVLRDNETN